MDVFSATNKQVIQQQSISTENAKVEVRQVENMSESTKTQKEQLSDKEEIKKSLDETVKNLKNRWKH